MKGHGRSAMSALTACVVRAQRHASSSSPPPRRDYAALFERGRNGGAPPLFLAPRKVWAIDVSDERSRSAPAGSTRRREFTRSRGAIAGRQPGEAAAGHRADRLRRGRADGLGEVRVDHDDVRGDAPPPTSRAPNLTPRSLGSNETLSDARGSSRQGGAPRVDLNALPANVVTGKARGRRCPRPATSSDDARGGAGSPGPDAP